MRASNVVQLIENAASEYGNGLAAQYKKNPKYVEEKYRKFLDVGVRNGARDSDLGEILADHIYDDIGFVQDLVADAVYNSPDKEEVLDDLSTYGGVFPTVVKNLRSK